MEANKTVNEELRSQKSTNMLIGYVLALAAMFVAFEYTQREVKVVEEDKIYDYRMEEDNRRNAALPLELRHWGQTP